MSINWVMLAPTSNPPFTPLPNEQSLYTSPPRIALSITTPSHYPGRQQQPFSLNASTGVVYLTNRRIIYIPAQPTEKLQSFTAPILNLHDSHVTAPFFGPNVWLALLRPVSGGGIPIPSTGVVELKLTFKEGGAFDFHTNFERVKERLQQALEATTMSGDASDTSRGAANGVDVSNVNLEDLPAYREESDGPLVPPTQSAVSTAQRSAAHEPKDSAMGSLSTTTAARPGGNAPIPPSEPPPGYEESQMAGLQEEVERRSSELQQ